MPLAAARHVAPIRPRTDSRAPRKDIQALRALAVGAVVLNHLWPVRLSGGYVGVDVFFVISGFLITTHLVKEIVASGRVRLARFYARRVLRLLPAAFLVIVASLVAVWLFLPYNTWSDNARHLFASAVYVENWVLAGDAVDYLAQTQQATVAQHYWSLSVEEQFYLVWPLLLVATAALARRVGRMGTKTMLGVVLTVTAGASFLLCLTMTSTNPAQAYFATPVRVWEFALGGVVALAIPRTPLPRVLAEVLSVLGFAAIIGASFLFGAETAFPGSAALVPVLGTAAVLVSGAGRAKLVHEQVTGNRAVQFLGDVSYSIYLWHWPLVVVLPFALSRELTTLDKLAIGIATILLSTASKYMIEDPGRKWPWALERHWRAFAAMGAGIAVIAALGFGLHQLADHEADEAAARAELRASGECAGPRSLDNPQCPDPFGPAYDTVMGPADNPLPTGDEWPCAIPNTGTVGDMRRCDFANGNPDAPSVWLVGDSHANHWLPALLPIAEERGWRLTAGFVAACPAVDATYAKWWGNPVPEETTLNCTDKRIRLRELAIADSPDILLTSSYSRAESISDGTDRDQFDQYVDAYRSYWQPYLDAGTHIYAIADTPLNETVRDINCVALNPEDPNICTVPRSVALPADPIVAAAESTPGVSLINLSDKFCDEESCYAVIGGIPVFYDINHINRQYMNLLTQDLAERISAG